MPRKSKRRFQVCCPWIEQTAASTLTFVVLFGLCAGAHAQEKSPSKKQLLENLPPIPKKSETVDRLGPVVVGEEAPWFAALDARSDLKPVNLNMLRKEAAGGVVVLAFFATWCKPCINGLRLLAQNKKALEKAGVTICLVDVSEEPEDVVAFVDALDLGGFRVVVDKFGTNAKSYGVMGANEKAELPRTFVVGSDGKILRIFKTEGKDFASSIIEVSSARR